MMEILSNYFNVISFLLFLFLLSIVIRKLKSPITRSKQRLPPGPWKLPIIGSLHHLVVGAALPHHALRNLSKKYGPLMHLQLGEVQAVVISSSHIAKQVLKVHDLSFAARPSIMASDIIFYNQKDIVFAKYGDYWKHMRKICTSELLGPKAVKSFSLIRQEEVHNLVSSIRSMPNNSVINMTEKVCQLISSVVSRSAFGKICGDKDDFHMIMGEVLSFADGLDVADLFPSWKLLVLHKIRGLRYRLMNAHHKLDLILEKIIDDHKEKYQAHAEKDNSEFGREGLIDVLLKVMENDELQFPMTNDNIKAVIIDMFAGGTETISTTIQWALSEMIKNPNVMVKAQEEVRWTCRGKKDLDENDLEKLKYLKLVIKETLRLHLPTPLLGLRECTKETKIDGYTIPFGAKVIVNGWAIARDPESWDDPENFVPERFENSSVDLYGNQFQYIPFGAGSRICPGIHFGLANVEYPLAQLLYHFDWKLPDDLQPEDLDMIETPGISATRKNPLHLIAIPQVSQYIGTKH